ncbi:glycosidase [Arthrobacter sp. SX1312]|uniref:pullulanase X25 domain-containing protein n=1 Tax=Arthrobacter sp. SX1312 TaxID=2058896 RepID=UPI000CE5211A|nr:glycosidase [Arthrobacter sp. SX1312]
MAKAVAEVPFDDKEAELLAGGVPRGFKALTTATSKLVKAGWLVKGRSGWTATDEGVRAVAAFADPEQFVNAMISGAPVPEQVEAVVHAPQAPEQLGEQAQASPIEDPTPPDVPPTLEVSPDAVAEEAPPELVAAAAEALAASPTDETAGSTADLAWQDQPQSVALSGDFAPLFGDAGHWSTDLRELQFAWEPTENLWLHTLQLPAGTYQFKILVNGSWEENYGRFGTRDGANHELHLISDTTVTFRFDYGTKDIRTS